MAHRIIEVGGANLIFGLSWDALRGLDKEVVEIRELAEELGAKMYVRSASESDTLVGFYRTDEKQLPKIKINSGAHLFAAMPTIAASALWVWDLDQETTIVVGAKDGQPKVGFDFIGDRKSANMLARDFLAISGEYGVSVYGNSNEFDLTGKITPEMVAATRSSASELAKVRKTVMSPMVMAIASIFLLTSAYGGYMYWDAAQKEEAARKAAAAKAVDPNKAYAESLASMKSMMGVPAGKQWSAVESYLSGLPMHAGGWYLAKSDCALASANCALTWEPLGASGTFESFNAAWKVGPQSVTNWDQAGGKIETAYALPQATGTIATDHLPTVADDLTYFGSMIRIADRVGAKLAISPAEPFAMPSGVDPSAVSKTLMVKSGSWQFDGEYWMADYFNTMPDGFTLDSVTMIVSDQIIKIVAKGKYYAKS